MLSSLLTLWHQPSVHFNGSTVPQLGSGQCWGDRHPPAPILFLSPTAMLLRKGECAERTVATRRTLGGL